MSKGKMEERLLDEKEMELEGGGGGKRESVHDKIVKGKKYLNGFYYSVWKKTTMEHYFFAIFHHHQHYSRVEKIFILFAFLGFFLFMDTIIAVSSRAAQCEANCARDYCDNNNKNNDCEAIALTDPKLFLNPDPLGCNVTITSSLINATAEVMFARRRSGEVVVESQMYDCKYDLIDEILVIPLSNYFLSLLISWTFQVESINKAFRQSDDTILCGRRLKDIKKSIYCYLIFLGMLGIIVGMEQKWMILVSIVKMLTVGFVVDYCRNMLLLIYVYLRYLDSCICCGSGSILPAQADFNYNSDKGNFPNNFGKYMLRPSDYHLQPNSAFPDPGVPIDHADLIKEMKQRYTWIKVDEPNVETTRAIRRHISLMAFIIFSVATVFVVFLYFYFADLL